MAAKNLYSTEQFIKAIVGSGGLKTAIADKIGCSWNTVDKYIKTHPTIRAAYDNECERINDMAQHTIMVAIKAGDVQMCRWWLAKKRKHEFGETLDLTSGNEAITLRVIYDKKEQTDGS